MQTDSESIQIQLGQTSIKLMQFRKSKSSGDLYARFGIPDVGLHYSFHRPKPPLYPLAHFHLKSYPLHLHEDILDFDLEDLEDLFLDFADELIDNISEPEPDKTITMLPLSANTFSSGSFNVLSLFQAMTGTYYRTSGNRLSRLMMDKPSLQGAVGISDDGIIIPLDKDNIFEIPLRPNFNNFNKLFLGKPLNSFVDPLTRALETIQRTSPNSG